MTVCKHALLLEDDEGLRFSLEEILVHFGFKVVAASNSFEFTNAMKNGQKYDLLITDLDLGEADFDGIDAIVMLRKQNPNVPVVMVTADSKPEERFLNRSKVDFAILNKPFTLSALLKVLLGFHFELK